MDWRAEAIWSHILYLHHHYRNSFELHQRFLAWSQSKTTPLAGFQPEPAFEPFFETCLKGSKMVSNHQQEISITTVKRRDSHKLLSSQKAKLRLLARSTRDLKRPLHALRDMLSNFNRDQKATSSAFSYIYKLNWTVIWTNIRQHHRHSALCSGICQVRPKAELSFPAWVSCVLRIAIIALIRAVQVRQSTLQSVCVAGVQTSRRLK